MTSDLQTSNYKTENIFYLTNIMNLSILQRSIPTHSLPMVLMKDDAKSSAADSFDPKLVTIDPIDSANSS